MKAPLTSSLPVAGQSADLAPKRFNLVRQLAVTSILAFVVTASLLVLLYRHDQLDEHREIFSLESEQNATTLAKMLGVRLVSFVNQMTGLSAEAVRAHADIELIDRILEAQLPASALKVKLYSPAGKVLYSSVHDEIGSSSRHADLLARAMKGETSHRLEYRERITTSDGEKLNRHLIQTYTPLRQAGRNVGVFEIYADMTPIVERINERTIHIALVIGALFATLFAALYLTVRRADRALIDWEQTVVKSDAQTRLYASVFQHSGEAILISDRENRVLAVNAAFTRMTGYSLQDVKGENPRVLASGKTPSEVYQAMWAGIQRNGYWQGELVDRRKDGSFYPKWISIAVVRDAEGVITHHIGSFTDITERKAAEERITHLAHHDPLTGLFNRFSLQERLEQALATQRRDDGALAVIFIDMDRFKTINDTLGHAVGDELLVEVAHRLLDCVRESDIVSRLGGDEFVVVLTEVNGATSVARIAEKILKVLGATYRIRDHDLHSTPSLGIAFYPGDGDTVDSLMRNADTAMYHAKAQGRNNAQFFTEAMNLAAMDRLRLDHALRVALAEGQFELYYQPKMERCSSVGGCTVCDLKPCRAVGVEALIRWNHPTEGVVLPMTFIPVAEETRLILPLGRWVIDEACRQLRSWRSRGIDHLVMAVNLSVHQLRSATLIAEIQDTLAKYALQPSDLELEITESVLMDDPEVSVRALQALRDLGIRLAIDDFGTGYSSLSYLKRLPIHTLKLDKSFVHDINTDASDAAIATATIALAHNLQLTVVAEGVETEVQRALLSAHACDFFQGYLFSRPMPADAMLPYLLERNGSAPGTA